MAPTALPRAGAPVKVFLLPSLPICILILLGSSLHSQSQVPVPPTTTQGSPRLLYSSPMLLSPSAVHTLAHFRWLSYECGDFYFFFLNHSSFLVSRTALDIQWPLNKVLLNGGRTLLIIFTGVII